MKRRIFLKTSGAALAISVAGSAIWVNTRTPTRALAPWDDAARGFSDPRVNALAYALLAPSPHNRQPWKVTLVGDDVIDVYCDLTRRLPETDPFDRQILIGLGCFIELIHMGAAQQGFSAYIQSFPDGTPGTRLSDKRIARIRFIKGDATPDPLFSHILARRSVKEVFDVNKPITANQLQGLTERTGALGTINQSTVHKLSRLAFEAMKIEFLTPHTLQESTDLMRIGKKEIEANPDGIDIGGAGMEALATIGLLTRENFSDADGPMVNDYLASLEERYYSSAGYVWMISPNSRNDQLQAGRQYVRLNLTATAMGISLHPVSQILQEYPEMNTLYDKFHETVGATSPLRGQMLARIGYGPPVAKTPRWPITTLVTNV